MIRRARFWCAISVCLALMTIGRAAIAQPEPEPSFEDAPLAGQTASQRAVAAALADPAKKPPEKDAPAIEPPVMDSPPAGSLPPLTGPLVSRTVPDGGGFFMLGGIYPFHLTWFWTGPAPSVLPAYAPGLPPPAAFSRFLGGNGEPTPLMPPGVRVAPAEPGADPAPEPTRPGIGGFGVLAEEERDKPAPKRAHVSNAESIARARQFIAYGDEHFRSQDYSEAYQRYKKAAVAAPDLADVFVRQGLAQFALGRYAPAVRLLRHALSLERDWPQSPFRLDELYGDNRLAKLAHLERLAAATEQAASADLVLLVGVVLYVDGQVDRSRPFFNRAGELGADRETIAPFLEAADVQKARRAHGPREL